MKPALLALGVAAGLGSGPLAAQGAPATPQNLRHEDDHAALGAPCGEGDDWACLKRMRWGEHVVASVGGEWFLRGEWQQDPRFGQALRGSDLVALQRATAFADVEVGAHWRVFGQLYSALEGGRDGGPLPTDENRLEWQNAFVEWRSAAAGNRAGLRLGQQELRFGSARLIDAREGLNVRRSFAGARGYVVLGAWRLDALDVRPRNDRFGAFDDERSDTQRLRGVHASRNAAGQTLDLYALELRDRSARNGEGLRDETRRSLGLRVAGRDGPWDWDLEGLRQSGDAGPEALRAHALMLNAGYTLSDVAGRPRLGLVVNEGSGDARPGDGRLGTFSPMFPRGAYLGEDATFGLRNLRTVQATLGLTPQPGWSVSASLGRFWRLEASDALYRPNGALLLAAGGRDGVAADAVSVLSDWSITSRWSLLGKLAALQPGEAVEAQGFDDTAYFAEATLRFRF
jgi:hypothetical protein